MERLTNSDLMDVVAQKKEAARCDQTLQIKPIYAKDGLARGIWKVDEKLLNGHGVAMGGFVVSAADIMMAYAIASLLDDEQTFASININTTFHRPALIGEVEVESKVERKGQSVAYVTAELTQNGKKVASSISSIIIQKI